MVSSYPWFFVSLAKVLPYIEPVEIEVCPFLCFPPVVSFPFEGLISHGDGWGSLGDGPEEDSTPANRVLLFAKEGRQIKLFPDVRCGLHAKRCWFQRSIN